MRPTARLESEAEAIVRAQRYEAEALADLFDANWDALAAYLGRVVGDGAATEELARQTWTRALAGLPRFHRFSTGMTPWLRRVANAVLSETAAVGPASRPGLTEALRRLTADQLDVLGLRFVAGMSIDQVAQATGRSRSRVEALQHRGLLALRRSLAESPLPGRVADGVTLAEPSPRQLEQAIRRRVDGAAVAEAVGLHPAAEELEALLELAEKIGALPQVGVPSGARDAIRKQFLAAGDGHRLAWVHHHRLPVRRGRHPLPTHGFRWGFVVATAVVLALLAGMSLALAAQLAEPDSSLYGLKLDTEKVLLTINRSPTSRAAVRVQLAGQRFRDAEAMAAKGQGDLTVASMAAYYDQLRQAGQLLASAPKTGSWTSVRDQFDTTEGRPIDPILAQLQNGRHDTAIAQVKALAAKYAKDRSAIDAKLHPVGSAPNRSEGAAPLPSGAAAQPAQPSKAGTPTP
jgi:RNA polymerase sigma-70 factor (ECF subfamily)